MPPMPRKDLAPERWDRIRELLQESGAVRLSGLCARLKVSAATVRRDLEGLEKRGELERVHGGAVCVHNRLEEPIFDDKAQLGAAEKSRIAQAALEYVKAGDTIYLDAGSTVLGLARLLRGRKDLTVVTNSVRAIQELSVDGPKLIVLGGEVRQLSQALVGPLTRRLLDDLRVDKAFMGTLGLTLAEGLTTTDPAEAYTKELAMTRAGTVILLVDSNKVGKVGLARSGHLEDVDILITDKSVRAQFVKRLTKKGINIVQA